MHNHLRGQRRSTGRRLGDVALIIALFAACSAKADECDTPLPDDLKIVPPTASVPPEHAKFSGRWGPSKWDGKLCHNLVVEQVTDDGKAQVVYSWGVYDQWFIKEPGFRRWTFDIIDDKLVFSGKSRIVKYRLSGETLEGSYQTSNNISQIKLERHR